MSERAAEVAAAVERVIADATMAPYSNGVIEAALGAAVELSQIGTKHKETRRRLAEIIAWCREGLRAYHAECDMLLATWAKRDDSGEIITESVGDKGNQRVAMRNQVEYQLALNELRAAPAKVSSPPPRAFAFDDLDERFVVTKNQKETSALSADLAARLGPFCTLTSRE